MRNATSFEFMGRKPSKAQLIAKAKTCSKAGYDYVTLSWGENWIDIQKDPAGYWSGYGWMRDIPGEYVARELNHA